MSQRYLSFVHGAAPFVFRVLAKNKRLVGAGGKPGVGFDFRLHLSGTPSGVTYDGIVISAIMVILAIIFLIIAKQYVAIKDYSSLSYSKIERKKMSPWGRVGVVVFLVLVLIFAFIPYIGIGLDSFGRGWALTPIPVKYTLQYFERVAIETPKFIINSLLYSGISVFICIIVGVPVAWVMARTKVPGRDLLDSLTTLILALPGTGIGIAYMRAFRDPLPFMNTALLGMWIVIPIVLGVDDFHIQ